MDWQQVLLFRVSAFQLFFGQSTQGVRMGDGEELPYGATIASINVVLDQIDSTDVMISSRHNGFVFD